MARRGGSPVSTPLPKVSFIKVQDDYSNHLKGVHDLQARSYGYNDTNADFQRPDHYIRYIEPLESELAVQVEYDMDEQDQAWLDTLNADRKKEQLDKISYETFEIVMDRLEKEWFDLTKNIPKSDFALPSEDSTCAICDDSEGENTNAIVFCDGCNLAVHQDCYGVPYIPEGQWLCRKCTVFPENPVSCILCPNEGGAFKQTVHGEWVHLLCAIWVPETRVANEVFMEPVTGVDKISKQRWKLKCEVCGVREGACIQCNKTSCFLAFHATCARKERLLMPMKASQGSEAPTLACFCERHLPEEQADAREAALAAERNTADDDTDGENPGTKSPKSSKTARAYAKTYKPGPPIVPFIIVRRILQYIGKINIRHKDKFVLLVCRYWSLKREVRRGAPLLKRLHLEPWTANSSGRAHTDEDKAIKLEFLKRLRDDLERVRVLTQTTRKREVQKLHQVEAIRDVLAPIIFPHEAPLRMAFEKIMSADRFDFFKNPVNKVEVPDYYDIIKKPLCWNNIDQRLDAHQYWDLQEFKDDVNLVLTNAMLYNAKTTAFYKAAERIQNTTNTILKDLEEKLIQRRLEHNSQAGFLASDVGDPALGDLEPPLSLLNLLSANEPIQEDTDLILAATPLDSLFNFEFPVFKPPPPPPPRKPTRTEHLEAKRRERKAALDSTPGFRAPRTRHARAQAAAFEAEATCGTPIPIPSTPPPDPADGTEVESLRKGKKHKVVLPGQSEEVPMVEDVDNQESFKMFNAGWVLPPDRRRGNRPPVEKRPAPPPRKRQRTEREKSHLSSYSTSAVENDTLKTPSASIVELPDALAQEEMQVDIEVQAELEIGPSHAANMPELSELPKEAATMDEAQVLADQDDQEIVEGRVSIEDNELIAMDQHATEASALDRNVSPVLDVVQTLPLEQSVAEASLPYQDAAEAPSDPIRARSQRAVSPSMHNDTVLIEKATEQVQMDVDEVPPITAEIEEPSVLAVGSVRAEESIELVLASKNVKDTEQVVSEPQEALADQSGDAEMEQEQEQAEGSQEPEEQKQEVKGEDEQPRKVIIIETLDTPETRREKNRRKKEERQRMAFRSRPERGATSSGPASGPSNFPDYSDDVVMDEDTEDTPSELTVLTDLSDEEEEEQEEEKKAKAVSKEPGTLKLREDGTLEGGTLVWAKIKSWPWWPAVVFEPDDPDIPEKILGQRDRINTDHKLYLVRFYDKRKNWQWVDYKKMLELGENEDLDGDMVAPNSKRQRWRNANDRSNCRAAFREAQDEME